VKQFLVGSAVALVAAFLGYAGGWLLKKRDDDRRRRSLATALLVEICFLENTFHDLYTMKTPGYASTDPFHTMIYDAAKGDLLLFSKETLRVLSYLYHLTSDARDFLNEVRLRGVEPFPVDPHWVLRTKIFFAAKLVGEAKRLLEKEGGHWPGGLPTQKVEYPNLPPLPAPAFESFDPSKRTPARNAHA